MRCHVRVELLQIHRLSVCCHVHGYHRFNKRQATAEISQRADGGGDTHPAPFDDVPVGELTAANHHACPGRDTAGPGDSHLDGSTGRQVESVQPGGGLTREGRLDRKATMEGGQQEPWVVGEFCTHVKTAADAPPARTLELPPAKTCLPCFN